MFVSQRHLRQLSYIAGWLAWVPEAPFDGVLVIRHGGGPVHQRTIKDIPLAPSHIALLSDGRILIAQGRARKDESGIWMPNAFVCSSEGDLADSFCIGDDIDVLISGRDGSIWTAYGDEGIYGGHAQSMAGLAGWNTRGHPIWAPDRRLPEWPVAGFSAATDGDHVWLAWYSRPGDGGTFLTRIAPSTGEVESWPSPVEAPDGLAIRGRHAILTRRDHNKRSIEMTRGELVDGRWTVTDQQKIEVPGPVVLRCGQGRDGILWLRAGDIWLTAEA